MGNYECLYLFNADNENEAFINWAKPINHLDNLNSYQHIHAKLFCENLANIINDKIIPLYGKDLTFNIELGLFTSDEYGSYKISFNRLAGKEICYIIADTIQGEWTLYECNS
jgi:hypothetical protein